MNKRRKRVEDLKVERVTVQVTEFEKELINRLAERQGLEVAAYVRKICIYDEWNKFGGEI